MRIESQDIPHHAESSGEDVAHLRARQELQHIAQRIQALHEQHRATAHSSGVTEVYQLLEHADDEDVRDIVDFWERAQEVLKLEPAEDAHLEHLFEQFLMERATPEEREELVEYYARFQNAQHTNPDYH